MMKTSQDGFAVLHYFEQCKLEAYPDPGSKDGTPWTIGWGHTGADVRRGLVWTQEQADAALVKDLEGAERDVLRLVKVPLNQRQFDALALFVYNCGAGSFEKSTLLALINENRFTAAALQFARWIKNDGKPMLGLYRRRMAERALWQGAESRTAIALAKSITALP